MTLKIAHNLAGDHVATMATGYVLGRSSAGAGAVEEIPVSGAGSLFVLKAGDTMTGALTVESTVTSTHQFFTGRAGSGTGGAVRFMSDDGNWRWYAGILGPVAQKSWSLYDIVNTRTILDVHATTGAVTVNSHGTSDNPLELHTNGNTYLSWYRSGVRKSYIQSFTGGYLIVNEEAQPIIFYTNSTERIKIPSNAAGIEFPSGAGHYSSNAYTLDDYEEGTWAPNDYNSGTALNGRLECHYVKIGRFVWLTIGYHAGSNASDANQFTISNLPFTPQGTGANWQAGGCYAYVSGANKVVTGMVQNQSALIYTYNTEDSSAWLRNEAWGLGHYALTICYQTST